MNIRNRNEKPAKICFSIIPLGNSIKNKCIISHKNNSCERKRMKERKLFCEISPFTYKISLLKERTKRRIEDFINLTKFANKKDVKKLPVLIYEHKSLMRRKLGNVSQNLQENKVTNLSLAAPKVSGILIRPGEIFSFWKLVGNCSEKKGYKMGLTISLGRVSEGIGGGMCQFTNLLHWMVLHTPLTITEHHHHDGFDLFPDFGRQIPFGTGTSVFYNHIDYRLKNNTDQTFQIIVYTTDKYLCGEIRAEKELPVKYHIYVKDEKFVREKDNIYRVGKVYRRCNDKKTGNLLSEQLLKENHAKVMYEISECKFSISVDLIV